MFYKMIENKCNEWYTSASCPALSLVQYIERAGQMRDAQIQAIRIYLYLKIACSNQPLSELFAKGQFNSLEFDELIPVPPVDVQYSVCCAINEEVSIVEQNKRLIEIFQQKIKDKIAEAWGERI